VWLGIATLVVVSSPTARAGEPLKPFVVLILDTSGSMGPLPNGAGPTGAGPTSCGGTDTRINHATCAINRIVNSYGDMVFALARFRETTSGTFATSCDANGDLNGNVNFPNLPPSGGDQCNTQGAFCGDCDESVGLGNPCTNGGQCFSGVCSGGRCAAGFGACTTADREFELLTPLVDGNNQLASFWTDGGCATCSVPPAGTSPTTANEIWGVSPSTFTPLAAVLNGAKRYWLGLQATDGTTIWPNAASGFAPIFNDPTKLSFIPPVGQTTCNPNPATCSVAGTCGLTNNCCCAEQCRPYITILLTDGAETCTLFGNTTTAADSMLRTDVNNRRYRIETKPIGFGIAPGNAQIEAIAQAGGAPNLPGNEGFYAANEAELQLAISSILDDAIKTEVCNDIDDDCDNLIDEDFPGKGGACDNGKLGVCRRTGALVCKADGTGLQCDAPVGPNGTAEVCNNLDDDCDGKTDEGLVGCTCSPQGEQCDNDDDDCDTRIDEGITRPCGTGTCLGTEACTAGVFGGCTAQTPTTEICNGLDDNCDGVRDGFTQECSTLPPLPPENFPPDDPRNNPGHPSNTPIPENICKPGTKTCPANIGPPNSFGTCLGEVKPKTEVCNNLDDDCDNLIDEGTGGADCSSNCGVGTTVCVNGQIQCSSVPATSDDTCDGNDDDCDGNIDEDYVCANPPNCPCTASGQCNAVQSCVNGVEVCQGDPVSQESCDCLDNDCDTLIDEGSLCGAGATCTNCQCAFACSPGEFPCPLGKFCKSGFCIADPCSGVSCPPVNGNAQTCQVNAQGNQGTCVDVCSVTDCAPLICLGPTGECAPDDCRTFPERCAANQTCVVNGQNMGECVTNLCQGVTCPADQYCVAGQCRGSCADVECPTGERCRLGTCVADPCGKPCPFGQACNDSTGECVDNGCAFQNCPLGQWCNPNTNGGTCEPDPCVVDAIECPSPGEECRGGTCVDPADFLPDAGVAVVVTTGGGGGCSTSGGAGLLLGLALLAIARPSRGRGSRRPARPSGRVGGTGEP